MIARTFPIAALLFLAAITLGLAGCATTKPVPVALKRQLPSVPAECDPRGDDKFPRVSVIGGKPVGPVDSAKWGVRARQWGTTIQARRRACAVYTRRMQSWR